MAALAADAPQTYAASTDEIDEPVLLGGTVFTGSVLVKHGTTAAASKVHASETAGFTGMALGPGVSGDVVPVRCKGFWIGAINDTVAAADEGTAVYIPGAGGAASDNPADATKTSTTNLPWGKIHRVLVAGGAGANKVVIRFEADSLRSI